MIVVVVVSDSSSSDTFRAEVAKSYNEHVLCCLYYCSFQDQTKQTGADLMKADGIISLVPKEWKRRDLLGAHKQVFCFFVFRKKVRDADGWQALRVVAGECDHLEGAL